MKLEDLESCVTLDAVRAHQATFQSIANDWGGNREWASAGELVSVEYVHDLLSAAGYQVTLQPLWVANVTVLGPSTLAKVAPVAATYVEGSDYGLLNFTRPGDVVASVTAVDLSLGSAESTSGCEPADFADFPEGHIALLQRGGCTFFDKAHNAASVGAAGVIIFNSFGTAGLAEGSLGTAPYNGAFPVLEATYARGEEWANTSGLQMHMIADVQLTQFQTRNVIAESTSGDPANVVVVGGYLDSANGSPGINANGSGAAAILETALQLAEARTRNRLRFVFWTAHDIARLGAETYVNSLSPAELDAIALYLEFHLLGSPNGGRFVLDGDGSGALGGGAGAGAIEMFFGDFFASRGMEVEPALLDGQSEYQSFLSAGIPVGGITAGADAIKTAVQAARFGGSAGIAFDPCYRLACDTFSNVDLDALDVNSDAVAAAVLTFAMNTEAVNGQKGKGRFKRSNTPPKAGSETVR
jgi:Zn-dependent M28 family amino/carboxypeptidase